MNKIIKIKRVKSKQLVVQSEVQISHFRTLFRRWTSAFGGDFTYYIFQTKYKKKTELT